MAARKKPAKKPAAKPAPEPEVMSSGDLGDVRNAGSTLFSREPTDTEAKLAEQGLIPPIRR